jgi:hypothetical protein
MQLSPSTWKYAREVLQNPALNLELHMVLQSAMTNTSVSKLIRQQGTPLWQRRLGKDARHDN